MSRTLTAQDRSTLIRLASTLPAGSSERTAILAGLTQSAAFSVDSAEYQQTDKQGFNYFPPKKPASAEDKFTWEPIRVDLHLTYNRETKAYDAVSLYINRSAQSLFHTDGLEREIPKWVRQAMLEKIRYNHSFGSVLDVPKVLPMPENIARQIRRDLQVRPSQPVVVVYDPSRESWTL
jgi:hypothetical protein